jgi:hypothetical protein
MAGVFYSWTFSVTGGLLLYGAWHFTGSTDTVSTFLAGNGASITLAAFSFTGNINGQQFGLEGGSLNSPGAIPGTTPGGWNADAIYNGARGVPLVMGQNATVATANASNPITGQKNASNRWGLSLGNATNETGANAGSDFDVVPYNDAGAALPTTLHIARATQIITVPNAIVVSSDEYIKEHISTIDGSLDIVAKMRGVKYTSRSNGIKQLGFIAQEMQEILPEVVHETTTTTESSLGIQYTSLIAVLANAINELSAKVAALEAKAAA